MIIDVRGNGGGNSSVAHNFASIFFDFTGAWLVVAANAITKTKGCFCFIVFPVSGIIKTQLFYRLSGICGL